MLTWTHPTSWRDLNTVDVRLADAQGVVLWVRFDEARNAFSLCETNVTCGPGFEPGRAGELRTEFATLFLDKGAVRGSGPAGPTVDLTFAFSLAPAAAGRVLRVTAAASDDAGSSQDSDEVGTLTVMRTGSASNDGG